MLDSQEGGCRDFEVSVTPRHPTTWWGRQESKTRERSRPADSYKGQNTYIRIHQPHQCRRQTVRCTSETWSSTAPLPWSTGTGPASRHTVLHLMGGQNSTAPMQLWLYTTMVHIAISTFLCVTSSWFHITNIHIQRSLHTKPPPPPTPAHTYMLLQSHNPPHWNCASNHKTVTSHIFDHTLLGKLQVVLHCPVYKKNHL